MAALKQIEVDVEEARDLALIGSDDSVWVAVTHRWWDLATILWWWLLPSDRRAVIKLTVAGGRSVRIRAARMASRHVRVSHPMRML